MSAPALILADQLIGDLRYLCALPSSAGQDHELVTAADTVAEFLQQFGLEVKLVRTAGAPVVLGRRPGRSPHTLLLYHHYDVAPPGPWRAWSHEPFQLAERDHMLFARGVAHGKGPLVAHMQAVRAVLEGEGDLPCGLVVVVEGEGLSGSPHLAEVLASHTDMLQADAGLASSGERDAQGRPFCYSGSKGLLQVRLSTSGSAQPLVPGMASIVRSPIWRIVWAVGNIKGEDEEIRITGFYDAVEGPSRSENTALRQTRLDEIGRLAGWQIPEFLFGISGVALVRAETTLPTCNLSHLTSEPANHLPSIPTAASAHLDFQLVPAQHPDAVFDLLREHLIARNFLDITVERLPGGYPPARTEAEHPFVQRLLATGTPVYGTPLTLLPLGPFTVPLHAFAQHLNIPVASLALARNDSAVRGPNEHLPIDDLIYHGQLLVELLVASGGQANSIAT